MPEEFIAPMYKPKEVSFGESLIKYSFFGFLALLYLILPGVVIALLFTFPLQLDYFFSKLFFSLGLVYLFGGFFLLATQLWLIWDGNFIGFKRGQWREKQKRIFFKVAIPENYNKTPDQMIGFLDEVWGINPGLIRRYDQLTDGKWYFDLCFDFVIRNGKTEIYFSFYKKIEEFVVKIFETKFPDLKLISTDDPLKDINTNWQPNKKVVGNLTKILAFDCEKIGADVSPFKDPASLKNNPVKELLASLESIDDNGGLMVVIQYVFRPYVLVFKDDWAAQVAAKKRMEAESSGTLVTEKQKSSMEAAEGKIRQKHYRTRVKFAAFFDTKKDNYDDLVEKFVNIFFLQTGTLGQALTKSDPTATNRKFKNSPFPVFDGIIGPIMNRFYFAKDVIFRAKMHLAGLIARDPDMSTDSMKLFLAINEIPTFFHWPVGLSIFPEEFIQTKPDIEVMKTEEDKRIQFDKLAELRQKALEKSPLNQPQPISLKNPLPAPNLPPKILPRVD